MKVVLVVDGVEINITPLLKAAQSAKAPKVSAGPAVATAVGSERHRFKDWYLTQIERAASARSSTNDLFIGYQVWALEQDVPAPDRLTQIELVALLRRQGERRVMHDGRRTWRGIRIR